MSQGTPNIIVFVIAAGIESIRVGLISSMDMVTASVNRVVRWLDKR